MEVLGYILIPVVWLFGILSVEYLLASTALLFSYGVCISVCSDSSLEEAALQRIPNARDLALLTLIAVIENFGYRQINNIWRVKGYWQYLRGDQSWGEMTRTVSARK